MTDCAFQSIYYLAETRAKQAARLNREKYSAEALAVIKAVEQAVTLLDNGKKDDADTKLTAALSRSIPGICVTDYSPQQSYRD